MMRSSTYLKIAKILTIMSPVCFTLALIVAMHHAKGYEIKAKKFDQHCLSVRGDISTSLDMLFGQWPTNTTREAWQSLAVERFAMRGDDIERCTELDMHRFADCHFRRDWSCAANFMTDARASIEVP
jgi:hypothetical protein